HPDWKQMGIAAVGRALAADYVIYLEINSLSMYEPGSNHQLFHGRASINVELVDVSKPDDLPQQEAYSCTFPSAQGPVPVAVDTRPPRARKRSLGRRAPQLRGSFANPPGGEEGRGGPVFWARRKPGGGGGDSGSPKRQRGKSAPRWRFGLPRACSVV